MQVGTVHTAQSASFRMPDVTGLPPGTGRDAEAGPGCKLWAASLLRVRTAGGPRQAGIGERPPFNIPHPGRTPAASRQYAREPANRFSEAVEQSFKAEFHDAA